MYVLELSIKSPGQTLGEFAESGFESLCIKSPQVFRGLNQHAKRVGLGYKKRLFSLL